MTGRMSLLLLLFLFLFLFLSFCHCWEMGRSQHRERQSKWQVQSDERKARQERGEQNKREEEENIRKLNTFRQWRDHKNSDESSSLMSGENSKRGNSLSLSFEKDVFLFEPNFDEKSSFPKASHTLSSHEESLLSRFSLASFDSLHSLSPHSLFSSLAKEGNEHSLFSFFPVVVMKCAAVTLREVDWQTVQHDALETFFKLQKANQTVLGPIKNVPEVFNRSARQERIYFQINNRLTGRNGENPSVQLLIEALTSQLKQILHELISHPIHSHASLSPHSSVNEIRERKTKRASQDDETFSLSISHAFALLREGGGHHMYHIHTGEWIIVWYGLVPKENAKDNQLFVSNIAWTNSQKEEIALKAKEGEIVLHPGWIRHGTREIPWKSTRVLFGIAVNVNVNEQDSHWETFLTHQKSYHLHPLWSRVASNLANSTMRSATRFELLSTFVYHRKGSESSASDSEFKLFTEGEERMRKTTENKNTKKSKEIQRDIYSPFDSTLSLFKQELCEGQSVSSKDDVSISVRLMITRAIYEEYLYRQRILFPHTNPECRERHSFRDVFDRVTLLTSKCSHVPRESDNRRWNRSHLPSYVKGKAIPPDSVGIAYSNYSFYDLFYFGSDCNVADGKRGAMIIKDPRYNLNKAELEQSIHMLGKAVQITLDFPDFVTLPTYVTSITTLNLECKFLVFTFCFERWMEEERQCYYV